MTESRIRRDVKAPGASGIIDAGNRGKGHTIFYGWYVVAAGTVIFMVSSGIGFYGHSVLLDPLREYFGWSKGVISFSVTLYFLTAGWMGLFIGRIIDQYGPRPLLIIGSLVVGLSFFLLSRITEVWELYAVYIIMAAGWSCTSVMPISALVSNWFIRKRGRALGITMTGLSIGGIIMVPLATSMIYSLGLRSALPVLGCIFPAVVIPLAVFVIKKSPRDTGEQPDGLPAGNDRYGKDHPLSMTHQMKKWTGREAMKTVSFWAIVGAFFFAMTGQNAFLMHQISFLRTHLGPAEAASVVSITAGASIFGRLAMSSVIDRFDKRRAAAVLFLFQALTVLSLAYTENRAVLYLGTFIFGLTMGNILMMQSLITGECFGITSFATVYGTAAVFVASGSSLGPTIAGIIYDLTESYRISFIIFSVMSILAAVTVPFARPPGGKKTGTQHTLR